MDSIYSEWFSSLDEIKLIINKSTKSPPEMISTIMKLDGNQNTDINHKLYIKTKKTAINGKEYLTDEHGLIWKHENNSVSIVGVGFNLICI